MNKQSGVFLLEALVAILIFAFGALGMLAMSSAAVTGQADAQIRTDAAGFADQLAGQITLNVDRTSPTTLDATLAPFVLNSVLNMPAGTPICTSIPNVPNLANAANPNAAPVIDKWVKAVTGLQAPGVLGLPGATATSLSIVVNNVPSFESVTIIECWQGPNDRAQRSYITTVYVNY